METLAVSVFSCGYSVSPPGKRIVVEADDIYQVGGVLCRCTARVAIPEHEHSGRGGGVCLG